MADGARRILDCNDIVISFNGIRYDIPKLAEIVGITNADVCLKGTHYDMRVYACRDRWPPRDEEDGPILGPRPAESLPTLLRPTAARPSRRSRRLRAKQLAGLPHGGRAVAKDHRSPPGQDVSICFAKRLPRSQLPGADAPGQPYHPWSQVRCGPSAAWPRSSALRLDRLVCQAGLQARFSLQAMTLPVCMTRGAPDCRWRARAVAQPLLHS